MGTAELPEILVATTWDCNLKCAYCYVRDKGLATAGQAMSPEMAARVVDALDRGLAFSESVCLHLYGGEPLLNLPAMAAMIERAGQNRSGRFSFAITTNGVIGSPAAIDLLEAGRFSVVLSIDGPEPIHDECRRTLDNGPTHADVMNFLQKLRTRTRCRVRGSAVVRAGWSLAQAGAYLSSLPVDAVKAQAVRLPPDDPHTLNNEEKQAYLRDLEEVGHIVINSLEAGLAPRDDRFSSRVLQLLMGAKRKSFCGAGRTTFGITPDGTVLPCILIGPAEARLGHILDDPSVWIREGKRWQAAYQSSLKCEGCPALPLCGGGCPALSPHYGEDECGLTRKNCEVATRIYDRFRAAPEALLILAGIN